MKRRWQERREEMLAALDKANAQATKRMETRWRDDREHMSEVATKNAAKGSAALLGTHYTPDRSRRASEGQRGKTMGGGMAKGPEHPFADYYSLRSPGGEIFRGRNILEFVRGHEHLFDPRDLVWRRGSCNAGKSLSRLRPTIERPKNSWKEWTWA